MRSDPEGSLNIQRRVVAGRQVQELVVADGDVVEMGVAVLPDADDARRTGRLCVDDAQGISVNQEPVVRVAGGRVGLHPNDQGQVGAATDPVAGYVDLVALNRLVLAKREVNADVLIDVSRRYRGVQVVRDANVVVQDLQVVEGVNAACTIEEGKAKVKIEDFKVGDSPVLIVPAVKEEEAFEVGRGQIAGALNPGRAKRGSGERNAVQVRPHEQGEIVDDTYDSVVAQCPGGRGVGFGPVESAAQRHRLAVLEEIDDVDQPAVVVVGSREAGGLGGDREAGDELNSGDGGIAVGQVHQPRLEIHDGVRVAQGLARAAGVGRDGRPVDAPPPVAGRVERAGVPSGIDLEDPRRVGVPGDRVKSEHDVGGIG